MMLSEKEKQFILYWEKVRERQSRVISKLLNGLPMAFLFFLPVLLLIFIVNIFFPDWYAKMANLNSGSLITIVIAVFICSVFFSYFRMHHKWEVNEQLYKELKHREQN